VSASRVKRGLTVFFAFVLGGCTQVVDTPKPRAGPPVAPITALQVGDLLSPSVQSRDGNLFTTVEPLDCSGVAREVDPPFIVDFDPAATDGGHWAVGDREVYIEEMVGVYPATFDPKAALAAATRTVESCRDVPFTVTTMRGGAYAFRLLPRVDSGSPDIVAWSYRGVDWACDSALVAARNAAVEISTCGPVNGFDVLSLARDALKRIDALANTTA
jgi:hypothetical protein